MEFKELETKRLRLKLIDKSDRDFIFGHFSAPSTFVTRYLYDEEPFTDISEADGLIDFYTEPEPRNQQRWILITKDGGEKIGTCGFHCWDRERGTVELGYDLDEPFTKKGYMNEAVSEIISFAKAEMQVAEIFAHIYPDNIGSLRLAEKLSFSDSGETITYNFRGNEYVHKIYSLKTNV